MAVQSVPHSMSYRAVRYDKACIGYQDPFGSVEYTAIGKAKSRAVDCSERRSLLPLTVTGHKFGERRRYMAALGLRWVLVLPATRGDKVGPTWVLGRLPLLLSRGDRVSRVACEGSPFLWPIFYALASLY